MTENSAITPRAKSLDALRGFAILTMVLSGVVPYGVLPAWMYHAQIPPPSHTFNPNLPGLTWVDLVFPFFLFSLGMAIPIALGKRLDKGESHLAIVKHILSRGLLLGFFAILLPHLRPDKIFGLSDAITNLLGIAGFGLMFLLFMRFPASWSINTQRLLKGAGWLITLILLMTLSYGENEGFSLYRNNIILVVLTNVYVFGSLVWLFTRNRLILRLGLLGILLGLRLAHTEPGYIQWLWDFSPIPWIYKLYYLQYLFIVIPASVIGDMYVRLMQNVPVSVNEANGWSNKQWYIMTMLGFVFTIVMLVGFQNRWLVFTALSTVALGLTGLWISSNPITKVEKFISELFRWGFFFLIIGCIFEPFEGGIKKDKSTIAYYLITSGLAMMMLLSFYIVFDHFRKVKFIRILTDNGQNPMIAYVGIAHFILPVLGLLHLQGWINAITAEPWIGFLRGLVYTALLALMVQFFTKRKIFWRT
ncbi:MAG: DUF5009 domain-containing protein [Calditrichales bacterium]|nr:MAG: DUF5009 domain-containing protein [Calditrichales bacterium]